jgi:hypothetical protein
VIEDLQEEFPELARVRLPRPRVSSEPIPWAFLSALGAGFVAGGIADIALSVLWPLLVPPTQPHPEWMTTFAVSRLVRLVATGAVALRAGGIAALLLCCAYEAVLVVAGLPGRVAFCERAGPEPAVPCDAGSIAAATWPTWFGVAVGAIGARWLLPPAVAGVNTLLRAAGALTFTLVAVGTVFGVLQQTILHLPGPPSTDAQAIAADVAISVFFLVLQLVAGLIAGTLLRHARPAAVLLLALLVAEGIDLGLTLIRSNVERGVPHPPDLALLQSIGVLMPIAGALGIAIGRLLARGRRNLLVTQM